MSCWNERRNSLVSLKICFPQRSNSHLAQPSHFFPFHYLSLNFFLILLKFFSTSLFIFFHFLFSLLFLSMLTHLNYSYKSNQKRDKWNNFLYFYQDVLISLDVLINGGIFLFSLLWFHGRLDNILLKLLS